MKENTGKNVSGIKKLNSRFDAEIKFQSSDGHNNKMDA